MANSSSRPPPPPQRGARTPTVLVVGEYEENIAVLAQAFGVYGTSARTALLAEAPALLGSVRPDLIVVFGPDAEIGPIQHLLLGAGSIPVAVLAARDRQRQALSGFPPGSLMLVPRTDSELGAIARLAGLASRLAREPAAPAPSPSTAPAPQPAWGQRPPPPSRASQPPPPPSRAQAQGPDRVERPAPSRQSVPPPPPVRAGRVTPSRQSVPPPPPRRPTGRRPPPSASARISPK